MKYLNRKRAESGTTLKALPDLKECLHSNFEHRITNFELDACIKCSACTAQCPVAAVNPLFPGPKQAAPDAERLRLEGVGFAPEVLELCSNCKTCEITCPSGVKITGMISTARRQARESHLLKENWQHVLRRMILGRAEYVGRLATVWPELTNGLLRRTWMRSLMERTVGISKHAPLPAYRKKVKAGKFGEKVNKGLNFDRKQLIYFPGCFTAYNDPLTAAAVVKVLEHNGYEVIMPGFRCCGVPLAANGHFAAAGGNAGHNLRLLFPYLEQGLPVITACPSCGLALKQDYAKINADGADLIGKHTYDLFEFLWELFEQGRLREMGQQVDIRLGYHVPCHLKAQGIGTPVLRLLRMIPGVRIEEIDGGCCGLSGSYGFKVEKYDLAMQIGAPLFAKVKDGLNSGKYDKITTECGVCSTQIAHGSGAECYHPVWILLRAYGLALEGINESHR